MLLFDGGDCVLEQLRARPDATRPWRSCSDWASNCTSVCTSPTSAATASPSHRRTAAPPEEYAARTVLWTAGVEAVPFARRIAEVLGVDSDHAGRIAVEPDLSVPGHPEVFVIGDLVGRDNLPGVAENAMQGGLHAAACVRHDLAGKPRRPYRYRDLGSAAYISRGHALLQAGPVKLAGFTGWLAWGFIHIAFLTGFQNRFSTVATWLATIARARRTDRTFILGGPNSANQPYMWSSFIHPGES